MVAEVTAAEVMAAPVEEPEAEAEGRGGKATPGKTATEKGGCSIERYHPLRVPADAYAERLAEAVDTLRGKSAGTKDMKAPLSREKR